MNNWWAVKNAFMRIPAELTRLRPQARGSALHFLPYRRLAQQVRLVSPLCFAHNLGLTQFLARDTTWSIDSIPADIYILLLLQRRPSIATKLIELGASI